MQAPQLRILLEQSALSAPDQLADVAMLPRWTFLVGFTEEPPAWQLSDEQIVGFETMPVRPGAPLPYCHVLHASAEWSREHLELTREAAAVCLTQMFDGDPEAQRWLEAAAVVKAHRWRYALTETPLGAAFSFDTETHFGFSGDWCSGETAEAAFLNGLALAERVAEVVGSARVEVEELGGHG